MKADFGRDRVFVNGRGEEMMRAEMRARMERGDLRLERVEGINVGFRSFLLPVFSVFWAGLGPPGRIGMLMIGVRQCAT